VKGFINMKVELEGFGTITVHRPTRRGRRVSALSLSNKHIGRFWFFLDPNATTIIYSSEVYENDLGELYGRYMNGQNPVAHLIQEHIFESVEEAKVWFDKKHSSKFNLTQQRYNDWPRPLAVTSDQ
jgi:hypothetical protein